MSTFKKLLALTLALAMVLSLAACGAKAPAGPKVSVFWYDEADVYLSTVRSELNKALAERNMQLGNGYGGLKDKTFRIAHMGELCLDDMKEITSAVVDVLKLK